MLGKCTSIVKLAKTELSLMSLNLSLTRKTYQILKGLHCCLSLSGIYLFSLFVTAGNTWSFFCVLLRLLLVGVRHACRPNVPPDLQCAGAERVEGGVFIGCAGDAMNDGNLGFDRKNIQCQFSPSIAVCGLPRSKLKLKIKK